MMRRLFSILFVVLLTGNLWCHTILIDGEEWHVKECPIQSDSILYKNMIAALPKDRAIFTGGIEEYSGYWSIQNNHLCIDKIQVFKDSDWIDIPESILQKVFKDYYVGDIIIASWVTSNLRIYRGDGLHCMVYIGCLAHEEEMILTTERGEITHRNLYHNYLAVNGIHFPFNNNETLLHKIKLLASYMTDYPELITDNRILFVVKDTQMDSLGYIVDCRIDAVIEYEDGSRKNVSQETTLELKRYFMEIVGPWETYYINGKYVASAFTQGLAIPIRLKQKQ